MLRKKILISLFSLLSFSQGAIADNLGTCPDPKDFVLKKNNLTYILNSVDEFSGAQLGGAMTRAIKCEYPMAEKGSVIIVIPDEYKFSSCNFNNQKGNTCKGGKVTDCVIYCDKR